MLGDRGTITVLDMGTSGRLLEVPVERSTSHRIHYEGALSRDGKLAAVCREAGAIAIHDLDNRRLTIRINGDFQCADQMIFHPRQPYLGVREQYGDWKFRLWNLETGAEDLRFFQHDLSPIKNWEDRPKCVFYDFDFSRDGRLVAFRDQLWLTVCDFGTGALRLQIELDCLARGGFRLKFTPDGTRIVVANGSGNCLVLPNRPSLISSRKMTCP
jgi:hypothetical protein